MTRLFRNLFARKSATSTAGNRKFRPLVDTLEERLLLNFDFDVPGTPDDDLICEENNVLYIRGTDESDLITVEIDQDDPDKVRATVYQIDGWNLIELDSETEEFNDFDRIEIRGFGEADMIANLIDRNDVITYMFGGAGRDEMYSGRGTDKMIGGEDNDTYHFQHEFNSIYYQGVQYDFANLGNDTIVEDANQGTDSLRFRELEGAVNLNMAKANPQTVSTGILNLTLRNDANQLSAVEKVYGSNFSDTILGNELDNYLYGYSGNDHLVGQGGDDYLNGGYDNDTLEGLAGDDSLYGDRGDDTYIFNNLVVSNLGTDTIREYAGRGHDTLDFSDMVLDQYLMGINLDLAITGDQDLDYGTYSPFALNLNLWSSEIEDVKATDGYDTVRGNAYDNHIWGYGRGDALEGRGGDDVLDGGDYNDTYYFKNLDGSDLGHDTVVEAANDDSDRLHFYNMDRGVVVNLASTGTQTVAGGALQLTLSSNTGIENVSGSQYGDTIYGNNRANNIYAYNGDDWVYGYNGNDTLSGGNGSDRLYGGNDHDRLDGGNNNDYLYGEGGQDTLIGGDGADYLNGDYTNHYVSDGYNDMLYGYTTWNNNDGDRDMFVHHRRYVYNGWYYTSVDAGWETLAGFNSSEDIRHYYYGWNF